MIHTRRKYTPGAAIIRELADDGYGELREDYSGRGMYGETCMGLVTDERQTTIEQAAARGLFNSSSDRMGKQWIVYWPTVKATPPQELRQ